MSRLQLKAYRLEDEAEEVLCTQNTIQKSPFCCEKGDRIQFFNEVWGATLTPLDVAAGKLTVVCKCGQEAEDQLPAATHLTVPARNSLFFVKPFQTSLLQESSGQLSTQPQSSVKIPAKHLKAGALKHCMELTGSPTR